MKIGFIGLGAMGEPMAGNLLGAGLAVRVWNRSPAPVERLASQGGTVADSPGELAARTHISVVMVSDETAVDSVLEGEHGWLQNARSGSILVNMATVRPDYNRNLARRLATHGRHLVEAPVMGSIAPARAGQLIVLASGARADLATCRPIFEAVGRETVDCGVAIGGAASLKLALNLYLGIATHGLVEVLNFARGLNLPSALLFDTLRLGPLHCGLIDIKREALETGEYPPTFSLANMAKDLGYVMATASAHGMNQPLGACTAQIFEQAVARGLADQDMAAIDRLYKSMTGH